VIGRVATVLLALAGGLGLVLAAGNAGAQVPSAPTVSLAAPGSPLSGTVSLTAQASAAAGRTIALVRFERAPAGGEEWTPVATAATPPFVADFDTTAVPDGELRLRAVATDSAGETGVSTVLERTVRNAAVELPVVTLDDPGTPLAGAVTLAASAAVAAGRTVVSVRFERSPAGTERWTAIAIDTTAPFTAAFDTTTVEDGEYDLRAVATDDAGAVGAAVVRARVIRNADAVMVTLVDPGERLSGVVTLEASVTAGAGRSVASVSFQRSREGEDDWQEIQLDEAPPFRIGWVTNDGTVEDGVYDLRAVATDGEGGRVASPVLRDRLVVNGGASATLAPLPTFLSGTVTLVADVTSLTSVVSVAFERRPSSGGDWTAIGGTIEAQPYEQALDTTTLGDGRYDFRVVVTDELGLQVPSTRQRGRLVDNTPPTGAIVAPASRVRGAVRLTATADDGELGSGVASVRFQRSVAGADAWTLIAIDTRPDPYAATLNSGSLPNGAYDLRVLVTDRAGNSGASPLAAGVVVDNPAPPERARPSLVSMSAPARSVRLLGSIADSPVGETWALGFTSAPAARVRGVALPYTSPGDQLVLLRYTDDGGWQIADVLRLPGGAPFPLLGADARASIFVTGAMTETGEAWIWVADRAKDGSRPPLAGLFHRLPGGAFLLDRAATDAVGAALLAPTELRTIPGTLSLRRVGGVTSGLLVSPAQEPRAVEAAGADDATVEVAGRLDYALLAAGSWRRVTAELPADYGAEEGERVGLAVGVLDGPESGWAALERRRPSDTLGRSPLVLARFDEAELLPVEAPFDAFDLTGPLGLAGAAARPSGLHVGGGEVWVGATVIAAGGAQGRVVARLDAAEATLLGSWCDLSSLPDESDDCAEQLSNDRPAAVPNAVFAAPGGPVALSLQQDFVHVFADGLWSRRAAPGFARSGGVLFASPDEGWLAGPNGVGRWSAAPAAAPLRRWPQANRTPLTSLAVPPGSGATAAESGALAVGLDGVALRFDASSGWLITPVPPRASHVNLLGVAFAGPSRAFAVGQFGTILRWDGSTWAEDPQTLQLTQSQLNAVAFSPSGEGWAVGTFGTILRFDGERWSLEQPPSEDALVPLTSVAVAGEDVFAVAGGNLLRRDPGGTWQRVPASALPAGLAPGALRLVSGLPDGGAVAAGRSQLIVRERGTTPFRHADQPLEGTAVALTAYRDPGGDVRAFVSIAPSARSTSATLEAASFPSGDGALLRQTDTGWQDLSLSQFAGEPPLPGDGVAIADPVLAVATSPAGDGAWVAGGYAGTVTAGGLGTTLVLAARPLGWRTSSIWRFDADGEIPPPRIVPSPVELPARAGTVSFAFFSSAMCRVQCSATLDAQPDVNLRAAGAQIASFAAQPGGPAFAVLGGNARGPAEDLAFDAGNGAADLVELPQLLEPLGRLPLFAALGPRDRVPGRADPVEPWADAFARAPAPFGAGGAAAGITPVSAGARSGSVHRYYAFDASQHGGRLRVIVLDNAQGSLEASAPGQTAWLERQLASARSSGVPVVVITALPLRGTGSQPGLARDAVAVGNLLVAHGVLAVFTLNGSDGLAQLNERYLIPEAGPPEAQRIPAYEGASLGYQRSENNGVTWYFVRVDTRTRQVAVEAVPVIDSLALKPLQGLSVPRSFTLEFQAVARRPLGTTATTSLDDSFPGFDSYVAIPAGSCGTRPCVLPSYSFTSSDPTIGDFVQPSAPGSRFPRLDSKGQTTRSASSGLFCAFNTGTTTVSVTTGLVTYSLPVTVGEGGFGPPCGTVFRAGVQRVVVVQRQQQQQNADGSGVPPPPAGSPPTVEPELPAVLPLPVPAPAAAPTPAPPPQPAPVPAPPAPQPAPVPAPAPEPAPAPVQAPAPEPVIPVAIVPPPVPPVQPVPPGGAVAQSPAAAPRREKAQKHATQDAFAIRPAGAAPDWFFAVALGGGGIAVLLAALGLDLSLRSHRRPAPAPALARAGQRRASRP
jgi:hypothetical protein